MKEAPVLTILDTLGNEKASQLGKLRGLKSGYRSVGLWGGNSRRRESIVLVRNQILYFLTIHGFFGPVELNSYSQISCPRILLRLSNILLRGCYHTGVGLWYVGILPPL